MGILDWIHTHRPGIVQDLGDRLEIAHESGEHSTLWKSDGLESPYDLSQVSDCYTTYDGMDLFSSTFKLASVSHSKHIDGVKLAFTVSDLLRETESSGCSFPSGSIPFMYQAGIGYYAVDPISGRIYEWDDDSGNLSDEFDSIQSVLAEWIAAIS